LSGPKPECSIPPPLILHSNHWLGLGIGIGVVSFKNLSTLGFETWFSPNSKPRVTGRFSGPETQVCGYRKPGFSGLELGQFVHRTA